MSILDSHAFKEYSKTLNIAYSMPAYSTFRNHHLPQTTKIVKEKLINILSDIENCNIVTDIWTDGSQRSYIGFHVVGIKNNWDYFKGLLACKRILGSHTNDRIYSDFIAIIN